MSNTESNWNDSSNTSECAPEDHQLTITILSVNTSRARPTSVQSRRTRDSELQNSTCSPGSSASVDACPKDESRRHSQSGPSGTLTTALPRLVIPEEEHSPGRITPSPSIPGFLSPDTKILDAAEQRIQKLTKHYPTLAREYKALANLYLEGFKCNSSGLIQAANARLNAISANTQSGPEAEFRTFRKALESEVPDGELVEWCKDVKDIFDVDSGPEVESDEDDDDD